ncbi:cobyrinate a,c-diamide synthase [Acidovorax sp. CCYZU-2555]|uniref:cobyrinate a,c-diamide synthase n=1 Tax=Acidovorax sp. CCYZU-2555 TaxID=2835042 RepID=UPI0020BD7644|nr:cobyrinate a,c-diamide synthase [Acidovorax sp. CCYZU-2555]
MKPIRCPALLITAPASGQGKTTLTAGLARLHTRQGRRVQVFKCGPDYLDPHWHQLASGAPVHSLDLWMTGEADARARLHAAAQTADLILIEGVMGLFDGSPSAADLARLLDIPVLAVIDASGMSATLGALAFGLQHFQPGLRWAGVLANRVASARHAQLLQAGVHADSLWQGAVQRIAADAGTQMALLPQRHLGLVAAHELKDGMQRLDAAADALAATPLGQRSWQDWQQWAVEFAPPAAAAAADQPQALGPWLAGRVIAVAHDAAFSFVYPANLDCLRAMGAELRVFSPLAGERLPACDALWLPGGYPELHAAQLAAHTGLQADILAHWQAGKAIWAECGGMLALCEGITTGDGSWAPLWGLMPGRAQMQKRLAGLGMQQLTTPWGTLRGHTFHYARLDSAATPLGRSHRPDEAPGADNGEWLYRHGSLHASFFHAWFASHPRAIAALLGAQNDQQDRELNA